VVTSPNETDYKINPEVLSFVRHCCPAHIIAQLGFEQYPLFHDIVIREANKARVTSFTSHMPDTTNLYINLQLQPTSLSLNLVFLRYGTNQEHAHFKQYKCKNATS
jgi:hypothetical protein